MVGNTYACPHTNSTQSSWHHCLCKESLMLSRSPLPTKGQRKNENAGLAEKEMRSNRKDPAYHNAVCVSRVEACPIMLAHLLPLPLAASVDGI